MSTDQQAQQSQMQQHQQYLGDVTQGLPEFDELDLKDCPLPGYGRLIIIMYMYIYRVSLTFSRQGSHAQCSHQDFALGSPRAPSSEK